MTHHCHNFCHWNSNIGSPQSAADMNSKKVIKNVHTSTSHSITYKTFLEVITIKIQLTGNLQRLEIMVLR